MDIKQAIIDRLRATKRENIESVIDYMENNGFFTYHCHSHHHYKGGLADHAWQTYQIAMRLDAERCAKNPNAEKLDEDSIAIASLLHDICDCSGLRNIRGHGGRSAKMLKELGLKLPLQEFLAIRFHMSLGRHKDHFLYDDALKSQLRYVVHKADCESAKAKIGYMDPMAQKTYDDLLLQRVKNWQHYLQNRSALNHDNFILETSEGWFMNLHDPYNGNIATKWKDQVIGAMVYDTYNLYGINDSHTGALYVLRKSNKKALFALHSHNAIDNARYFSPDKEPFIYDEINLYYDWCDWESYCYAACKHNDTWKLVKITQFPKPKYDVVGNGFLTAEEAMRSVGINDSERYLRSAGACECEF